MRATHQCQKCYCNSNPSGAFAICHNVAKNLVSHRKSMSSTLEFVLRKAWKLSEEMVRQELSRKPGTAVSGGGCGLTCRGTQGGLCGGRRQCHGINKDFHDPLSKARREQSQTKNTENLQRNLPWNTMMEHAGYHRKFYFGFLLLQVSAQRH